MNASDTWNLEVVTYNPRIDFISHPISLSALKVVAEGSAIEKVCSTKEKKATISIAIEANSLASAIFAVVKSEGISRRLAINFKSAEWVYRSQHFEERKSVPFFVLPSSNIEIGCAGNWYGRKPFVGNEQMPFLIRLHVTRLLFIYAIGHLTVVS